MEGSGMKESEGDRLKCVVYESTLSTASQKESQPRLAALGSPFQGKGLAWTLPPSIGRRCPEGAEVGWESGISVSQPFPRETGRGIHFSFTNFHLSMI